METEHIYVNGEEESIEEAIRTTEQYAYKLEFPEKEAKIWRNTPEQTFEEGIAKENVEKSDVFDLLDTQLYFDLMQIAYLLFL